MKTKTFLSVAFLLALVVILAIGAFAAEDFDDHAKTNVKGLSIAGYQVRTIGYNGHRTTFNFNSNAFADYELVEAGSIVATAANFAKYEQSFDESNSIIKYVDGEFVTPSKNVVKTAIYSGGEFVGNHTKTENGFTFSVTVTRFLGQDQYKAEIVNCGYEIWKTTDGSFYVVFTREEAPGYESNSLYKTTLSMLCRGTITIENSDNPIYNVLMECDHETFAPHANVDGYLFPDPLADGKFVALYIADSNEKISLESAGLGKYIARVSDTVFSKNLSLELPKIDDYWAEHIKEQLATLPEGKSFIAITDTHYESGTNDNAGKSADLMQYVRKMTGIEKVINLGDPFHQENTYAGAMEQLSRSMETKFFDYFGEDGMYAIGNHDSNVTMARSAEDKDIDPDGKNYKMDLILTDKDIYDNSFAHIEEGGKNNKNIVYDEKLLSIINDMYEASEIPAFVLENIAPEDAGDTRMFGNVNYSSDEMYANLVSWAKMHYAYYDHDSKICYIILNTGGLTVTDFATLGRELWYFHPSQYEFIKTIFNQISKLYSDYDVVIAGHMLYDYSYYDRTGDRSFNSSLFKMLSAFEAGTSVSFTAKGNNALSGKLFGCEDNATSRTLNYDFSDRKFTGEVICITGHSHIDHDLVSQTKNGKYYQSVPYGEVENNLSDNAVQLILLNQDNYKDSKSDWEPNSQDMVLGTITEHSFTIFTITDDNTLVATRIGANDGNKQKTYKLSNYDEGWTFTAEDSYKLEDSLSVMPRTVEAVINVPKDISKAGVIFGNYNESYKLNFEIESSGRPRLYVNGASHVFSTDYDGNPINVSGDGLVHVAITVNDIIRDTATLICYINGEPVQTITGNTGWGFQAGTALPNFKIGGDNRDANSQYFKGSIRYAAAYSYARTAEQIKADYENFGGDDPLFCYDLSGRKVSRMTDVSGNGNNAGKGVEGWTFTAADSYKLEDSLSKWPRTVEAVINVPKGSGRAGVVFGNYNVSNHLNFEIYSNGVPRLYVNGRASDFTEVDIRSDDLVHVAITVNDIIKDTATLICYINGKPVQTITGNTGWGFDNKVALTDFKIGGDNRDGGANGQYFKGSIKSVAAYSYARTPDQIMADYLNFGGDDPLFCYDLSGEKVSQMTDVSGNGNDAVNVN